MATNSGLEVDRREAGLHSLHVESNETKYRIVQDDPDGLKEAGAAPPYHDPAQTPQSTILGLRRATFGLALALLVVLILGIVAAAEAGTCKAQQTK